MIVFDLFAHAVVRGEKARKEYAISLRQHRAAVLIQKQMKAVLAKKRMKNICDASIVIQSGDNLLPFHFFLSTWI